MIPRLVTALRAQLAKEPTVTRLGLLGVSLGGVCAAWGLIRGFSVPPEGNLWETATFNGSVGVFLLTQAALAPEAGFTERGQRRWGRWLVPAVLYAFSIETVQAFRGLDPRFSQVGTPVDQILGGVFFLDAVLIMILFYVLAWRFFRAEATPMRVAVRYAAVAAALAFGVGIFMSFSPNARAVGDAGNLLTIHAAGFHGLQAVPLVALLFAWGGADASTTRRWVHIAGLTWMVVCVGVFWHTAAGIAPTVPSVPIGLAALGLLGWAFAAAAGWRSATGRAAA